MSVTKEYFRKNITKEDVERQKIMDRIGILVISTSIGIVIVIIMVVASTEFNIIEKNDISNWVTLIVEIGIGVIISMSILIYSRHHDDKIDKQNQDEKRRKEEHARKEIYRSLKGIEEATSKREGIRTKKIQENPEIGLETEVVFMNKQIAKAVEALQFQLLLHNENLPMLFIEKVKLRLEFLEVNLNRLEINPQGKYDPHDQCIKDLSEFIEKLKEIENRK
ncbi:MAG: hypothetical protein IIC67_04415 [Thaumarchaeota archaeon]|nr:hypothetical protein [Nitrososphaerota archaeon]